MFTNMKRARHTHRGTAVAVVGAAMSQVESNFSSGIGSANSMDADDEAKMCTFLMKITVFVVKTTPSSCGLFIRDAAKGESFECEISCVRISFLYASSKL